MSEQRRTRRRPPQVPPTPREPIGRDRAAPGAPVRRAPEREPRPERPTFPEGVEIDLPPRVRKDIDRLVGDRDRARDVKLALTVGTRASEEEDHAAARTSLLWAKHLAPRSAVVREALGIALYRAGDLRGALPELQAYRRLSGADDQNHLLADCLRAAGREADRALELARALADDPSAEPDRRAEAAIVAAAVHCDAGRPQRAESLLRPFLDGPDGASMPQEATVRLLWMAADAAEAAGAPERAVEALVRLRSIDPDYPDAQERLDRLSADGRR